MSVRIVYTQAAVDEAARKATQTEVERARLNLEATKIKAPIDGRVGRALIDAGNQVFGQGEHPTILTTITSLDPIGLSFAMDKRSFLHYQRLLLSHVVTGSGSTLSFGLSNEEESTRQGILEGFDDQVDSQTGTIRVRATVRNPSRLLLPGMFARIRMPFGQSRLVLEVPKQAITTRVIRLGDY